MKRSLLLVVMSFVVMSAACGGDDDDTTTATTTTTTPAPTIAAAQAEFCDDAQAYIGVLDAFGQLFAEPELTAGEVTAAAQPLLDARDELEQSASALLTATVRADEAEAPDSAQPTIQFSEATMQRVEDADAALQGASEEVSDSTPVAETPAEFTAAAYQLEVAWTLLLADAGCVEGDARQVALAQVAEYTAALQSDLAAAGFYDGTIDGVYGPETVAAVRAFQESANVPATGLMDPPSQRAFAEQAEGREASQVSALQGILLTLDYYPGPVDGIWSDSLEAALKQLQSDLGVSASGAVDAATQRVLTARLAEMQTQATTPTT